MAQILADRDIRKLLGSVIVDADEDLLNPNGIELRLGRDLRFHSTGEEKELLPGTYLKVNPGESVTISSVEFIDFTAETIRGIMPENMLMGLITPTTTMMREGISQVATKIDAGFRGRLNWGLRNGSTKALILEYGEPIFKLTIFALDADETPDTPYGERPDDHYQDSDGIVRSKRRIPADLPVKSVVESSFAQLDPKKQLREAGYPFDHIGTELTDLHGKFEVVSSDVRLMKEEFQARIQDLATKIDKETETLSTRLEEARKSVLERVEAIFERKFNRVIGILIGAIATLYGGLSFLEETTLGPQGIAFVAVIVGIAILSVTVAVTRGRSRN